MAFSIYTLVTAIMTPRDSVRTLPKHIWLPIIVLLPVLGSVLWFIFGRPKAEAGQASGNAYDTAPGGSAAAVNEELKAQRVSASDDKISELERRLQELDEEAAAAQNRAAAVDPGTQQNQAAQSPAQQQQAATAENQTAAGNQTPATTNAPEDPADTAEGRPL